MRQRYRLYRRKKGGRYYIHDDVTGKQDSLHTTDRATALRLLHSRSEAERQPAINLQIARAYLAATDPQISTRTWQYVMEEMVKLKSGETQRRWRVAIKDKAMDPIRSLPVLETRAEHFLGVLEVGKVSTNVYLRRLHNFALDMTWLPWPVIVKRQWPEIKFKEKRAITWEEHQAIVAREANPERKAFYQLAWHLGASQSDLAFLEAENVDWEHEVIGYARKKTGSIALMRFDEEVGEILQYVAKRGPAFSLPEKGPSRRPRHGVQTTLRRSANQWCLVAQLPLRLGGAGQEGGLPRAVCPGSSGPQQQGHGAGLFPQGSSRTAFAQ